VVSVSAVDLVVGALGQDKRPAEVLQRLAVPVDQDAGTTELKASQRLGGCVTEPVGGGHSGLTCEEVVVEVALPVAERGQCPGELPDGLVLTVGRGGVLSGLQARAFCFEPLHGRGEVGQLLRSAALNWWVEVDRDAVWVQELVADVGGVDVEVDHPV
jgi:hypothetical protein